MKVWYHLVAALTGLAVAALIVWFVFGNASQEGATQEGSAGALSAEGAGLCGTVAPAAANGAPARRTAADNLPLLADATGPIPALSEDRPEQKAWFARLHAAAGLCIDEVTLLDDRARIEMSTVEGVSEAAASAYAAGAIAQAFTAPLNRPVVELTATVDGQERTALVSRRAWNAFQIARQARGLPLSMRSLAQFRQSTSFSAADLRVAGWR